MVRFNDKTTITQLANNDILPMTDLSDTSEDKKVTVQQLSQHTVDNISTLSGGKTLTDNNLSNALKSNYDEAYDNIPEGIVPFSLTATYSVGNIVKILDSNNKPVLYYSVLDNNIGHQPEIDDGTYWRELTLSAGGGLELLDIGWALHIDETANTRRVLNGQLIMQNQFEHASNKLKSWLSGYPNLFCTEAEWQAEKLLSAYGQVGKFVIDDTAGTIRLPYIINVMGAESLYQAGLRQAAGLPNVTGGYTASASMGSLLINANGAFSTSQTGDKRDYSGGTGQTYDENIAFNASNSNPIYGNSNTVQQEAIKGVWFIQLNSEIDSAETPINDYQINNVFAYGMNMYYKGIMNNNSWLRSNNQWNAKAVYEGLYAWILENANNSVEGFKFSTATDYTDYDFVINTTDQTFRLPLKNGQEGMFLDVNGNIPVVGNGITLGVVANDGQLGGLGLTSSAGMASYTNCYGASVGGATQIIPSGSFKNVQQMGITTDPTKSGLIADLSNVEVPEEYNLYYFCGDTLENTKLINTARLAEIIAGAKLPKLKLNCYMEQFILPGNTHQSIQIKGDTFIKLTINGAVRNFYNKDTIELNVLDILDTGTALTAGKDYYIYLIQNPTTHAFSYKVSLNASFPSGETVENSYKIGGFHTLCVSVTSANAPALPSNSLWTSHPAIGYNAGDIIPNSIWCETHRPACPNPAGMVYIDLLDLWVDIYLQSGRDKTTASAFGATVTDSRTPIQHLWDMQQNGKRLARDAEFMIFAEGSNQKTAIKGAAAPNPKTAGGHLDTANKRMISGYFVEECCGYLWQWLDEVGFNGQQNWASYGDEGTRGQCYGMNYILWAGGYWYDSTNCGSRSRNSGGPRSRVAAYSGGRGVSLPKFAR